MVFVCYTLSMKDVEWIFFDIGGVLADESEFQQIRENYNWETVKNFEPGVTKEDVLILWKEASRMLGDLDVNVITLALKNKENLKEAIILMKENRSKAPKYYDLLKIRTEALGVVIELSKKYKLGLMANQNILVKDKLKEAGIISYFQNAEVSDDYKLEKPDPKFFLKIFETTGANPLKSIIIGDNIERDLEPAKKLGMITIWYKLKEREVPNEFVDKTIESLTELLVL